MALTIDDLNAIRRIVKEELEREKLSNNSSLEVLYCNKDNMPCIFGCTDNCLNKNQVHQQIHEVIGEMRKKE